MNHFRAKLGKTLVDVICCFGLTALFFAPHPFHCGYFGIIPWLIFSEHYPPVHFFPGRFITSVALWITCIVLVYKRLRYSESKSYVA
jgi:hypothetical protein